MGTGWSSYDDVLVSPDLTGDGRADVLGVAADARSFGELAPERRLAPGTELPTPQGVFPRFVDKLAEEDGAKGGPA